MNLRMIHEEKMQLLGMADMLQEIEDAEIMFADYKYWKEQLQERFLIAYSAAKTNFISKAIPDLPEKVEAPTLEEV